MAMSLRALAANTPGLESLRLWGKAPDAFRVWVLEASRGGFHDLVFSVAIAVLELWSAAPT